MGYRQYICRIEKSKLEEIRHLSLDELYKRFKNMVEVQKSYATDLDERYLSIFDIWQELGSETLFELGKYFDSDTEQKIIAAKLFTNEAVNNCYSDYDARLLNEQAFLNIAEHFERNALRHYELLLSPQVTPFEEFPEFKDDPVDANPLENSEDVLKDEYIVKRIVKDLLTKLDRWKRFSVLNKDKDSEQLQTTWLYEYEMFEMIRLYKTADYEKYHYFLWGY